MGRVTVWSIAAVFGMACGAEPPTDTPAAQRARGAEVYQASCHYCHDVQGTIGVEVSARILRQYETAGALFRYLRLAMPYDNPRSLTDEEYWALVGYLLADRSLVTGAVVVGASNADSIVLGPTQTP